MLCTGLLVKVTWKCRLARHVAAHLLGAVSCRERVILHLQTAVSLRAANNRQRVQFPSGLTPVKGYRAQCWWVCWGYFSCTRNRRLSTVFAMPLKKIRTWDQTLTTSFCGEKGEPAVTAGNWEVFYHPHQTYTRGWYYSPINKNSSFVLWFTL